MKWAYIIDDSEVTSISGNRCHFLESEITDVDTKTKEQEIAGGDGVLIGANNFGSFELTLKFYYDGVDDSDLILFTEKIKRIVHTRNAMYVVHSDIPGRKYAFNSAKIEWEKITNSDMTFSIVFNCYKGYAESLYDTDQFSLMSDNWQFGSGLVPDDTISYNHTRTNFEIFNGSSDTINPRMRHRLKIYIQLNAKNGFRLVNKTTGDIFDYKKEIDINTPLTLEGGYPFLHVNTSKIRCGRSTNHGIITLAPGYNKFEIWGNTSNVNIKFIFPFIYR